MGSVHDLQQGQCLHPASNHQWQPRRTRGSQRRRDTCELHDHAQKQMSMCWLLAFTIPHCFHNCPCAPLTASTQALGELHSVLRMEQKDDETPSL